MDAEIAINSVIKEVAIKNGVALSKDDPILLVVTMINLLNKYQLEFQKEQLEVFKSEIELILHETLGSTKKVASDVINKSLLAASEKLDSISDSTSRSISEKVKENILLDMQGMLDSRISDIKYNHQKNKIFSISFLVANFLIVLMMLTLLP